MAQYSNGNVYYNNYYIYNASDTSPTSENVGLNCPYHWQFTGNSGNWEHYQDLDRMAIESVSQPVSYSSSFCTVPNAVLLTIKPGALYTYKGSYYTSYPVYEYYMTFNSPITGAETPCDLGSGFQIVYDLVSGEVMDFNSDLNYWYGSGYFSAPTITAIS